MLHTVQRRVESASTAREAAGRRQRCDKAMAELGEALTSGDVAVNAVKHFPAPASSLLTDCVISKDIAMKQATSMSGKPTFIIQVLVRGRAAGKHWRTALRARALYAAARNWMAQRSAGGLGPRE